MLNTDIEVIRDRSEKAVAKFSGMAYAIGNDDLIRFFVEDIPSLLAEVDELRAENARLREQEQDVAAQRDASDARIASLEAENAKLREALDKIAGGHTDSDAPDVMKHTPDQFRGEMWSWRVARAALNRETTDE